MKVITEAEFNRELNAPASGYLFFGDEDYTKTHALRRLRSAICPDDLSATFNDIRLTPLGFSVPRLIELLEPLPFMSERKIISITGLSFVSRRPEETNALCEALAALKEYSYNTLVICVPAGNIDEGRDPVKRPSGILKRLGELLTPVWFPSITPARLSVWAGKHFEHNGVHATPEMCAHVIDYCGTSMYMLANEIDKMSYHALAHGRNVLEADDIYAVAIEDNSYNTFDFANAITAGDKRRALNIFSAMVGNRVEPHIIMGEISSAFCNMLNVRRLMEGGLNAQSIAETTGLHKYRVELYIKSVRNKSSAELQRIVSMCVKADAEVKRSRGYAAIERLICAI